MIRRKAWLGPEERILQQAFRRLNPLKGVFLPPVSLHVPATKRAEIYPGRFWRGQLQPKMWRVDDVCETPTEIWIIEYTPKVRDSAISRLLKYAHEYRRQFKPAKPVRLGLVAHVDDEAFHDYMRMYQIRWWIL